MAIDLPWWCWLILASPFITLVIAVILSYLLFLRLAIIRVAPAYRRINPNSVWLLLVPGFNIFWYLYIVLKLAASYRLQIRARGQSLKERPFDIPQGIAVFVIIFAMILFPVICCVFVWKPSEVIVPFSMAFMSAVPLLMIGHLCETWKLQRLS